MTELRRGRLDGLHVGEGGRFRDTECVRCFRVRAWRCGGGDCSGFEALHLASKTVETNILGTGFIFNGW